MTLRKTSAWPLVLAYVILIVYASLYPFADWRSQGIQPWAFLAAPLPRFWTGFDVATNVVGYAPLGFLLTLAQVRRFGVGHAGVSAVRAVLLATVLSFVLEMLQSYLPMRVPSNVDLALNAAGAVLGASMAAVLERLGVLARWSRFRARWFLPHAGSELVLLALWPFALLFPAPVPFGLGQVLERLELAVAEWLENTPFLEWVPLREVELQPLEPAVQMLCVAFGLLIPCLLVSSVARDRAHRLGLLVAVVVAGLLASALSAALSYGPTHAWAWLDLPTQVGVIGGAVLAVVLLPVPTAGCAALTLMILVLHAAMLNQAPAGAYFSQTLQTWEQGRFIRFNGVAQWLGWVWPFLAMALMLQRLTFWRRVALEDSGAERAF